MRWSSCWAIPRGKRTYSFCGNRCSVKKKNASRGDTTPGLNHWAEQNSHGAWSTTKTLHPKPGGTKGSCAAGEDIGCSMPGWLWKSRENHVGHVLQAKWALLSGNEKSSMFGQSHHIVAYILVKNPWSITDIPQLPRFCVVVFFMCVLIPTKVDMSIAQQPTSFQLPQISHEPIVPCWKSVAKPVYLLVESPIFSFNYNKLQYHYQKKYPTYELYSHL